MEAAILDNWNNFSFLSHGLTLVGPTYQRLKSTLEMWCVYLACDVDLGIYGEDFAWNKRSLLVLVAPVQNKRETRSKYWTWKRYLSWPATFGLKETLHTFHFLQICLLRYPERKRNANPFCAWVHNTARLLNKWKRADRGSVFFACVSHPNKPNYIFTEKLHWSISLHVIITSQKSLTGRNSTSLRY